MENLHDCFVKQEVDWLNNSIYGPEILMGSYSISSIEIDTLKKAFLSVLHRHESLRTIFIETESGIKQKVLKGTIEEGFGITLLKNYKKSFSTNSIKRAVSESLSKLSESPNFYVFVCLEKNNVSRIIIAIHHIISDYWSIGLLIENLKSEYERIRRKKSKPNDYKHDLQLKDYSRIKNCEIKQNEGKSQIYWNKVLSSTNLKTFLERNLNLLSQPTHQNGSWGSNEQIKFIEEKLNKKNKWKVYSYKLKSSDHSKACELSSKLNVSTFTLLITALAIYFYKVESIQTPIFSTIYADRHKPEYKNIIGHLIGGVYFHYKLTENLSLSKIIQKNYFNLVLSFRHAIFDMRNFSHLNLRSSSLVHLNYLKDEHYEQKNLNTHKKIDNSYYPLSISFIETKRNIYHKVTYHTEFYSEKEIEDFSFKFQVIFKKILDDVNSNSVGSFL